MAIGGEEVQGHAFDAELEERLGADVADAPELHLAGAHRYHWIDLAIDGEDLVLAQLGVFDQEDSVRQAPKHRKELLRAVDDQAAPHANADLLLRPATGVPGSPPESQASPAGAR